MKNTENTITGGDRTQNYIAALASDIKNGGIIDNRDYMIIEGSVQVEGPKGKLSWIQVGLGETKEGAYLPIDLVREHVEGGDDEPIGDIVTRALERGARIGVEICVKQEDNEDIFDSVEKAEEFIAKNGGELCFFTQQGGACDKDGRTL